SKSIPLHSEVPSTICLAARKIAEEKQIFKTSNTPRFCVVHHVERCSSSEFDKERVLRIEAGFKMAPQTGRDLEPTIPVRQEQGTDEWRKNWRSDYCFWVLFQNCITERFPDELCGLKYSANARSDEGRRHEIKFSSYSANQVRESTPSF